MQKIGRVTLPNSSNVYYTIWYENGSDFERIDVIQDYNNYNSINTSTCDAAYYRKTKELYYRDEQLIKTIMRTRSNATIFKAAIVQDVKIENGVVYITRSKRNDDLGIYWEQVLKNGLLESEIYKTSEMQIEIFSVSKDKGLEMQPINISDYIAYNITTDKIGGDVSDADFYSLDYLLATYPVSHIENGDYRVVLSMEEFEEELSRFKNAPTKIKAVDLETTGTETGMYGNDVITGIVLSFEEDQGTFFPFRQERFSFNLPIECMRKLLDAVNNQPEDVVIVSYNGKFEIQGVWKESKHYIKYSEYAKKWDPECEAHGLDDTYLRIDADAMFASIIVNPVFKQKGAHTLKSEAYKADGRFYLELEHIFKDKSNIRFNVLPPEIVRYYACPDTSNTIKVYKRLLSLIPKDQLGVFDIENKMIYITAENEFYGMRTQKQLLVDLIENEEYKSNVLSDYFRQFHKTNGNINSPALRREIFYNKLRCPIEVRTKKGLPSTSNVALARIVELGAVKNYDKSKIPPNLLDLNGDVVVKGEDLVSNRFPSLVVLDKYAKSQKELGAYKRIQRTSLRDRVMFYMNQYGAATGRRTSDAHQYSDGMKKLIVGDSEDHHLWSADFKQVELRILPFLAGQKDLIELEKNPDVDIHRAVLSIITGKPMWSISAKERKKGKSTNFGVVYMMSAYGLAKKNAGPAYTQEDYEDALASINDFYNGLPYINRFTLDNERFVRENGYIKTAFGRRRDFKQILDPTYPENKKKSLIRAANNMPVQGFGADLLKLVELRLHNYIKKMGWDKKVDCDGVMLPMVRLMLSIHDEVLVSTHKSIPIAAVITMFKECMEIPIEGAPPFFAAPALVGCWYDGKLDAYECDLRFRDEIVDAWVNEGRELIHADTYLEDLDKFRARRLNSYMDTLIAKYKNPDEVAKHVNHDELTHTLISSFIKKGEKYDHTESIRVATERFMERREKELASGAEQSTISADFQESSALSTLNNMFGGILGEDFEEESEKGLQSFDELEEYVNFDENGEAIFDEDEDEDADDLSTLTEQSMFARGSVKRERAIYSLNQVFIDLNDLKLDDPRVSRIYKEMVRFYDPEGEFQVYYMIDGHVRSLDFYMKFNRAGVTELIESIVKEENT